MSQIEKKCLTCTEKKNKKKQKLSQPTKKEQKNAPTHRALPVQSKYHHRNYLDITQDLSVNADGCSFKVFKPSWY
jgi:hypothetical protein